MAKVADVFLNGTIGNVVFYRRKKSTIADRKCWFKPAEIINARYDAE